jgi:hypothetical protein
MQLNKLIAVKTTLAKSINLDRDKSAKELLESYVKQVQMHCLHTLNFAQKQFYHS